MNELMATTNAGVYGSGSRSQSNDGLWRRVRGREEAFGLLYERHSRTSRRMYPSVGSESAEGSARLAGTPSQFPIVLTRARGKQPRSSHKRREDV